MPKPASLQKVIPNETKRTMIAEIARGDKKTSIAKKHGVSQATVQTLSKRNKPLIDKMKVDISEYRQKQATQILDASQKLLLRKIKRAGKDAYIEVDGETRPNPDYEPIDAASLARISKTQHELVRLEEGKPTSIGASTTIHDGEVTPTNLEALVEAIKSGDEVELQRIIFNHDE